ncbi:hypothetical protein B0H16DRAFT_1478718 [Mycena metata]|uniref:Uncharacterized protein n=1 Tax=Mycena metata TaxID=1033252 RepID=A0AAD7H6P9_9AGAR|nr:hypothetical protein B0H16DRAFT_1478718 [Mycena metata]
MRPGKQSSKSVEVKILSGQKKNCCSGSGYFAAGWLCCRALQEKTGDGEKEGASVAKDSVTGLNQFGLKVVEIFRDGDDSASTLECLVACLVAPHEFRSQLPAVPHACGTLVTVPHVTQPDCRRQLQKLPLQVNSSHPSTTPRARSKPRIYLPTIYTLLRKAFEHVVQDVPLVELPLSAADIAAACGNVTAAAKSLCPVEEDQEKVIEVQD